MSVATARHYEIVFMVHPDQSEQVPGMIERLKAQVEKELFAWFYINSDLAIPPGESSHTEVVSYKMENYTGSDQVMNALQHGRRAAHIGDAPCSVGTAHTKKYCTT